MATTTTPPATSSGFNWKALVPALEMAGNVVVSVLVPGGAALAPMLAQLENSVNPLIQSIGTTPDPSTAIMAIYGTLSGVLNIVKQTAGVDPKILAIADEYLNAAGAAAATYLKAQQGFDPAMFTPVTPIG